MHNLAQPHDKLQLWPTPVFIYKYRDWPYDKKSLLNVIDSEEQKRTSDIQSGVAQTVKTRGLKESDFDFLKKTSEYPILNKFVEFFNEAIADVVTNALPTESPYYKVEEKTVTPKIFESWYHKTNNGGAHGLHCHPGSSWAGIFYVNTPACDIKTNNGVNRFHNVNSLYGPGDLGSHWWNSPSIMAIPPEEGTLVMFPAWTYHEATPYYGDEDRVVIAFNSVVLAGEHND